MKSLNAIGVMTGTSCDGVDLAALDIKLSSGVVAYEELKATSHYEFPISLQKRLLEAQKGEMSIRDYGKLNQEFSLWLAEKCIQFLKVHKIAARTSIFGIHGQTLWHQPPLKSRSLDRPGFSLQMIDASLVAQRLRSVVVSHFRQPDLALGGQGAPLVPYYHWLKVQQSDEFQKELPLSIHNIGGMSNLTYLGKKQDDTIAFDTGPGNALIDLAIQKVTNGRLRYDKGGQHAEKGRIHWNIVKRLASNSYFKRGLPKTTGRELFDESYLSRFKGINGNDLMATVTAFTSFTMAQAYQREILQKKLKLNTIYFCGGGVKNKYLIRIFEQCFRALTGINGATTSIRYMPESLAPAQFLEAMAFGRFAIESLLGHHISMPSVTGAVRPGVGAALFQAENYLDLIKAISFSSAESKGSE